MNNIQNLHVVIPHINGEAVNHSATKRQPQSPLQNVIKLIAVQVVKILTPSKLWRLSTLDKAIPTSRRSGVTLRCTHSKQKCYSSVVTNTQQILATYKIYILLWPNARIGCVSSLANCWQMLAKIDLVRHSIYWCFMILITVSPSCKFAS